MNRYGLGSLKIFETVSIFLLKVGNCLTNLPINFMNVFWLMGPLSQKFAVLEQKPMMAVSRSSFVVVGWLNVPSLFSLNQPKSIRVSTHQNNWKKTNCLFFPQGRPNLTTWWQKPVKPLNPLTCIGTRLWFWMYVIQWFSFRHLSTAFISFMHDTESDCL